MGAVENIITDNLPIWSSAIQSKSSAVRGTSSKRNLYGVKKLRELILDLAVRGLLVPQDPRDEPASVLLEKIAAENERLVKEGKLKAQQKIKENKEFQKFQLPSSWEWSSLGTLSSNIHYGYTASASPSDCDSDIRFLRITDIQNDKVKWSTVPSCQITEEKAKNYLLGNNDILIARTGGTIGKSYLVENINLKAVFASYLIRVKRIEAAYSPFIKTYLGSQVYWKQLYDSSAGTGQPNVNATALKGLVVPIPPLAEQHRIVAKVDELMALCDTLEQQQEDSIQAHETLVEVLLEALSNAVDADAFQAAWGRISEHFDALFTTDHSIKKLKETILQLAVMGKLVPQDPNDEPASVLLEKITAERTALVKSKEIRKQKVLGSVSAKEQFHPLPVNWVAIRLNDVGDWGAGATPLRGRSELYGGSIPWFKSGELNTDYIFNSDETVTELALRESSLRLNNVGDVLLAMYGATIGKASILKIKATTNQAVCACRVYSGVSNSFLLTLLKAYRPRFINMGAGGAQPNISREKIIATPINLPPTAEQHRIVAKVDELMALCDKLKSSLQQAQETQILLTDAVVENAL